MHLIFLDPMHSTLHIYNESVLSPVCFSCQISFIYLFLLLNLNSILIDIKTDT